MKRNFALIDNVWMLVLSEPNLTKNEAKQFGESFNNQIFKTYPHAKHLAESMWGKLEAPLLPYNDFVTKYGTIVIRKNGTWMNYNEKDATKLQISTVSKMLSNKCLN